MSAEPDRSPTEAHSDQDKSGPIENDEQFHEIAAKTAHTHRREDVLRYLYWDKRLTQQEIADRLEIKKTTVSKWLRRNDIETRHYADYQTGVSIRENTDGRKWLVVRTDDGPQEWPLSVINLLTKESLSTAMDKIAHHRIPIYNDPEECGGVSIDCPNNLDAVPVWAHLSIVHDDDNPLYTFEDPAELGWDGENAPERAKMTLELDADESDGDDGDGLDKHA